MARTFIKRFQRIDAFIHKQSTGSSQELADKIGVSIRTIKEFVAIMREMGAPIYFNKIKNSYCYKERGNFNISFIRVQQDRTFNE